MGRHGKMPTVPARMPMRLAKRPRRPARGLRRVAKKPWNDKMKLVTRPLKWKLTNLGLETEMM